LHAHIDSEFDSWRKEVSIDLSQSVDLSRRVIKFVSFGACFVCDVKSADGLTDLLVGLRIVGFDCSATHLFALFL
jgi:hypothetical protein